MTTRRVFGGNRLLGLAMVAWLSGAAVATADVLVIRGGTVHPVSGDPYAGTVVVEDGVISAAGPDVPAPAGARVLDATGKHVYPGLFDAYSSLGLLEIGAVSATDDRAEMGAYNPHLGAETAVHPASEVLPVTRANGVTHALVAPSTGRDGVIAGQAAVIQLNGWTVEEMALETGVAMAITWPRIQTRRFDFSTFSVRETPYNEAKEAAEKAQNELRDWLDAARHYRQAVEAGSMRVETDPKLAALARCLDGGMPVLIRADAKRDIEAAMKFAEEEGLRLILAGGSEAWKLKEKLAEKGIPVVLGLTQSLPEKEDDAYDQPFRTAGELHAAGVKIAFASGAGGGGGPSGPHDARTTPYEAQAAVPFGLPPEAALRAVTLSPAEIFGLEDRIGSIDAGKVANLLVTDGDPLAIPTRIEHVVIGGEEVSTDNLQLRLYERYRSR